MQFDKRRKMKNR